MLSALEQQALVVQTVKELRDRGSWAGETHVQKTVYFLKHILEVPLTYQYVLYKHGPYSFDLHHDVGDMRAHNFLTLESRPPYGPSFTLGHMADLLSKRYHNTIQKYVDAVRFLATRLCNADVRDMERYATALYVNLETNGHPGSQLSSRINELKPHISLESARDALAFTDQLRSDALEVELIEHRP
jgi:hypothetical protein